MNASASLQQPSLPKPGAFPVLVEAKSTGDFTNTKKRRKEEAQKIALLKAKYGESIGFNLFLCGHFDTGNLAPPRVRETERKRGHFDAGNLGYEAAEGINWVWEHRIDDLRFLLG
ncbi:MAG: hypothetical protein B5766_03145 [Candidatus Lumbricidophila eiseniae]|uniref:Restriction endonuclease n=1 Tax=Candidatus Lumbricidiphila eiseniae TaxID=1969409 RepID=A0A2A6FTE9_9MICO|nr:MAG: hypothetical protein B5766_03145 [Candidatus Lumbricidophila eiseniae]